MEEKEWYSTEEAASLAGVTYSRLDNWERVGYLVPTVAAAGSGRPRRYTAADVEAARLAAKLAALGLHQDFIRPGIEAVQKGVRGECLILDGVTAYPHDPFDPLAEPKDGVYVLVWLR